MKNTNSTNLRIVQTYFDSLASGDLATLGSLLADDVVWHQPGSGALSGVHSGKAAVFELFGRFMAISEGSFRIDSVSSLMANGDLVTAVLHFSAKGSDGASISMNGVDLMRIEGGRIQEVFLFSEDQESEDRFWGRDVAGGVQ